MCEFNVGKSAGYERHRRRGTLPCIECQMARNADAAERKHGIKDGSWVPTTHYTSAPSVLLDHLETFGAMTTVVAVLQLEDRFSHANIRRALYRLADRGLVTKREDWDGSSLWAAA